jgi:hypothetical protein
MDNNVESCMVAKREVVEKSSKLRSRMYKRMVPDLQLIMRRDSHVQRAGKELEERREKECNPRLIVLNGNEATTENDERLIT